MHFPSQVQGSATWQLLPALTLRAGHLASFAIRGSRGGFHHPSSRRSSLQRRHSRTTAPTTWSSSKALAFFGCPIHSMLLDAMAGPTVSSWTLPPPGGIHRPSAGRVAGYFQCYFQAVIRCLNAFFWDERIHKQKTISISFLNGASDYSQAAADL